MKRVTRKYNPKFMEKQEMYLQNDLAFTSEDVIKHSASIINLLPPTKIMLQMNNPNADYLWKRYLGAAIWASYPRQYLEKILGLAMKGYPEVKGFDSDQMKRFYEYTANGVNILNLEVETITALVKFGSCFLKLSIPDNENVFSATLETDVIAACDVLEWKDKEYLVYKTEDDIFNERTKDHKTVIVIHVCAIDEANIYYEATMTEAQYVQWSFKSPDKDNCLTLTYPQWTSPLTEIPAVGVSIYGNYFTWTEAYSQPIIDISYHIFKAEADNGYSLHQQSTAHLLVTGASEKERDFSVGLGAIHIFENPDTKEQYIAPQTEGIKLQFEKLEALNAKAKDMLFNLISSTNASGESLKLQIGDKTNALVNMIKLVGNAIQQISEKAATMMGEDPDNVEFIPFTEFTITGTEKVTSITEVE